MVSEFLPINKLKCRIPLTDGNDFFCYSFLIKHSLQNSRKHSTCTAFSDIPAETNFNFKLTTIYRKKAQYLYLCVPSSIYTCIETTRSL